MHQMSAPSSETRRVVLVCASRCQFFLERYPEGLCVPEISIPNGQRVSAHLNAIAKSRWNLPAVSIGEVDMKHFTDADGATKYEILEVLGESELPPAGLTIMPASSLAMASLLRSEDRSVLEEISAQPGSLPLCGQPGPFSRLGWLEEARNWVEENVSRCGQCLTGSFRQLMAGASFSLIRFETQGDAVWLKAVGGRNAREYAITAELFAAAPQWIPEILAWRPEWHAWLSREAGGTLSEFADARRWQYAAHQLAQLQIALLPRTVPLLSAGAQDVRVPFLRSQMDHFFEILAHLMRKQTTRRAAPLTTDEIRAMRRSLPGLIAQWEELGIPDSVGHLDLNPENVLVADASCTFIDWAEAAVGPPFLTLQYFLEHVGQAFSGQGEVHQTIISAYTDPWKAVVPEAKLEAAIPLLPAITVYAYTVAAISGRDLEFLEQSKIATSFRSMGRRLHSELNRMGQRAAD